MKPTDRQERRDSFAKEMVTHLNKRLGPNWDKWLCPNCGAGLKEVPVRVQNAQNKAISWQCPECDYYEFENESAETVIKELRDRT